MSQGVYVLGGKCPRGKCPGGKCRGGVYVLGVSVRGVHVRGGYVLEPLDTALMMHTSNTTNIYIADIGGQLMTAMVYFFDPNYNVLF